MMLGTFGIEPDRIRSYSSWGAYYYVHTGDAVMYRQEHLRRVEELVNGGDTVVVEPHQYMPWMLCVGDLSENPANGANSAMARFYHKQAIMCYGDTEP